MITSMKRRQGLLSKIQLIVAWKKSRKLVQLEKNWKWRQREGIIPVSGSFPVVHQEQCISCGLCLNVCPSKALTLVSSQETVKDQSELIKRMNTPIRPESFSLSEDLCVKCGFCTEVCPTDALTDPKKTFSADQSALSTESPKIGAVE